MRQDLIHMNISPNIREFKDRMLNFSLTQAKKAFIYLTISKMAKDTQMETDDTGSFDSSCLNK